jgi:hypothetical protein
MGFLSALFGGGTSTVRTTVDRPLEIHNPVIGFLNLLGPAGSQLSEADQRVLGPLFTHTQVSDGLPPRCNVLFIYCTLNARADAPAPTAAPRDLIKAAGAHVAVFASENDSNAYIKCLGRRTDWGANIVMVLDRNGEKFALFFSRLFAEMFRGRSMLLAWGNLAPQGPGAAHSELPSAILAAEAGHITFRKDG